MQHAPWPRQENCKVLGRARLLPSREAGKRLQLQRLGRSLALPEKNDFADLLVAAVLEPRRLCHKMPPSLMKFSPSLDCHMLSPGMFGILAGNAAHCREENSQREKLP